MAVFFLFLICWAVGFILFAKISLDQEEATELPDVKVSVIIPARNEEKNLPFLLESLKRQSLKPYEVIVVNDFSEDKTKEIAKSFDVKVIDNPPIPKGWTGKNWALWNGYLHSSGQILIFLDADVRLSEDGIEKLTKALFKSKGAISVIPYHKTEKFYEKLCMIVNILGVFAFTSPYERKIKQKGLYGSCIALFREDYQKIGGHKSICSKVTDDLSLGKRLSSFNINIENYLGIDTVWFRMYPNGIKSQVHGIAKSAALSMQLLQRKTIILIALWVLGLSLSGFLTPFLFFAHHPLFKIFMLAYLLYFIQILYLQRYIGNFGIMMPLFHFVSTAFFLFMVLYSFYQVKFTGSVWWKGRQIEVGGK